MKKILCFIIGIIFAVSFIIPSTYATESETQTEFLQETINGAISFTCVYDVNSHRVVIDGTVGHDFLISHGDYKIRVYSIAPGKDYEAVISNVNTKPLAESDMTVKFTFYIDVSGILERYSMYSIVLCSPEGEHFPAGEPMLPSISSSFVYDGNKEGFKGILTERPSDIGYSKAGTVIVDVDISSTVGDASDSILYPMSDSFTNIRKSYVETIDKQVMAASLNGSRVYLRLLLNASDKELSQVYSDSSTQYVLPRLHSEYGLEYIFSISRFFAQRYDGEKYGNIYGMIVGTRIDDISVNAIGDMDVYEYSELYTLYLVVVGNAIRAERTDLDIVIPLSDANDYSTTHNGDNAIRSSTLLKQIIYRLDKNVSGTFNCSIMLESAHSPLLSFNEEGLAVNIDSTKITSDTIDIFVSYLNSLKSTYQSVPTNIIFMWTPLTDLKGNLLGVSYIYNYAKLASNSSVSSFTVNLSADLYKELETILKYIDTPNYREVLDNAVGYYGYSSWEEMIENDILLPINHTIIEKDFVNYKPLNDTGSFTYMDFTSTNVYTLMNMGDNCTYIRSEYNSEGERVISLVSGKLKTGESSEAICVFEYPEDYGYTPYLSLKMGISDANVSENALYRVTVMIGNSKLEQAVTGVIKNGETKELFFDISEFSNNGMAEYIKISTSPLTEDTAGCSLMLSELCGYSSEYDSSTLSELIEAQRLALRNEGVNEADGFDYVLLLTVIGIVFALAVTAVGLVVLFKRDEH